MIEYVLAVHIRSDVELSNEYQRLSLEMTRCRYLVSKGTSIQPDQVPEDGIGVCCACLDRLCDDTRLLLLGKECPLA